MSELKYNEPAERFAPTVEKSLYADATAVMVPSETGCWVHYVEYCERIANIKSEADAVIAELENKLQNESRLLKETRDYLIEWQKMHKRCVDNAIKAIRHHKYHRCLAMAKLCRTSARCDEGLGAFKYRDWYWKWFKRWLELAEKFKEED